MATGGTTLVSLVQRGIEKEMERIRANMHRERGETFSPPTPGKWFVQISTDR